MMFSPRLAPRRSPSWEVVTSQSVQPTESPFDEPEEDNFPFAAPPAKPEAHKHELTRSYVFELPKQHSMPSTEEARRAVRRARERFLQELQSSGQALRVEGWKMTILRKQDHYRIDVHYVARPGMASENAKDAAEPPYLEVIDSRTW
ncbi:hypothetical protein EXIGLDRAFT_725235 [Exidia glandulosa HHB12029]|uniref:Uncharacterized protein n=1 Tax=Exidia glandulosa HHB12029 TaxID=1314781 RepID=A0A165E4G5_EXIGL|nr:hypothetical protein EXIGLDRAFT_725235 [Exidia glandulosa HHB12029]